MPPATTSGVAISCANPLPSSRPTTLAAKSWGVYALDCGATTRARARDHLATTDVPSSNFADRDGAVVATRSTLEQVGSLAIEELTLIASRSNQRAAGGLGRADTLCAGPGRAICTCKPSVANRPSSRATSTPGR